MSRALHPMPWLFTTVKPLFSGEIDFLRGNHEGVEGRSKIDSSLYYLIETSFQPVFENLLGVAPHKAFHSQARSFEIVIEVIIEGNAPSTDESWPNRFCAKQEALGKVAVNQSKAKWSFERWQCFGKETSDQNNPII